MSWRCENGRSGFSGSTWVSLRMRNSIGSMPSFSAISSIAISSAIMPGASPGARMALPSGRSSIASRVAVMRLRAGVEQPRLVDRGLRLAARQIAGPAFMRDRRDLAVPRRADADALDRGRPVGGVVEHQRPRAAPPSPAARPPSRPAPPAARRPAGTACRRSRRRCRARSGGRCPAECRGSWPDRCLPQAIIWLDVQSVSLSPSHAAIVACGSIIAWLRSGVV